MSDMQSAVGNARLILGKGVGGMFAHATLRVSTDADENIHPVSISDAAAKLDKSIIEQCERYLMTWVNGYRKNGVRLCVEVIDVQLDEHRKNDIERGLNLAMRDALEQLGLPKPQIFDF